MIIEVNSDEIEEGCNGACLACGEIHYGGIEPDAREYECEACGEPKVYGLEEILIMRLRPGSCAPYVASMPMPGQIRLADE